MPVVTESRELPLQPYAFTHRKNGVLENSGTSARVAGSQTTTGFRSSRVSAEPDDSIVDAASQGSGLAARRNLNRALRQENRGRYDTGHEFVTTKQIVEDSLPRITQSVKSGSDVYVYSGPYGAAQSSQDTLYAAFESMTFPQLHAYGRQAIQRTAPTKPEVSLAMILLEAKQRLPSLVGLQTYRNGLSSRNTGGEYLNVEFGLRPLGADLGVLAAQVLDFSVFVKQLRRDSGRVVRRRTTLRSDSTSIKVRDFGANPLMGPTNLLGDSTWSLYNSSKSAVSVIDTIKTRVTFSGAFSYHLAEADRALGKLEEYDQLANRLLGSRINAELIYELTPWSWLLDWFSDAGTFVSNATRFSEDNLVLRYGYLMTDREARRERFQSVMPRDGSSPISFTTTSIHRRKRRDRSTPYGFGLDVSAFSPRKWAILGALGMTKTPNTLR